MRILVCGGRDYTDFYRVANVLDQYTPESLEYSGPLTIVQGEAKGADFLAKCWAIHNNHDLESYPADWKTYGKSAGYIRNKQMLEEGKPDLVIAFPGGRGTEDMLRQSKAAGVEYVQIVKVEE